MKSAARFNVVFVTAPDLKTARSLAQKALRAKLVACANLIPAVESHYRWKGKLERSREILIVFKTTAKNLPALEKLILQNHPYETAEFIALPLTGGSKRYLDWIAASVKLPGGN